MMLFTSAFGAKLNGVITQDANLRTGPGTDFPVITTLHTSTSIFWLKEENQWIEIEIPGVNKGWVHSSLVKKNISAAVSLNTQASIAVIDIQRVLNESGPGKAAKEKLTMLQQDKETTGRESIEEQIISDVLLEIQFIVETYAQKHGYTHVLNKNSGALFYHEPFYDITSDIIKKYDQRIIGEAD